MAKLARLPSLGIIAGFRGTLDFYEDRGLFIVRSWPRGKALGLAPGTVAQQPLFIRASRLKKYISQPVSIAARRYTLGGSSTWADIMTRAYYGKEIANPVPLPGTPGR